MLNCRPFKTDLVFVFNEFFPAEGLARLKPKPYFQQTGLRVSGRGPGSRAGVQWQGV